MRTVYLEPLEPGDIKGYVDKRFKADRPYQLANQNLDVVYFINPKLRMRIVHGVTIVDPDCDRLDRFFGKEVSDGILRTGKRVYR